MVEGGLHDCRQGAEMVVEVEEVVAAASYSSLASHYDMLADFGAEKS